MKKIGILGGSFNPIHLGHLQIAEDCIAEFDLDKIIFIPNSNPPHKEIQGLSYEDRYRIVQDSIKDNEKFEISDVEKDNSKKHYSFDTVSENFISDDCKTYFIMGDDEFLNIENWYRWEDFLKICGVIVFLRNKSYEEVLNEKIEIIERYDVKIFNNSVISISSTDIRERLLKNKPIRYLVKEEALCDIEISFLDLDKIKEDLKSKLSESRFNHSLRVAEYSKRLAKIYGVDKRKAYITGLVHDCAKGLEEYYILKNVSNFDILDIGKDNFYLLHAIIGKDVARKIYGIRDMEILESIEYHTTARANMSLLEKIVFISDKIEPNRDYKDVENLRKLADKDIDLAIIEFLHDSFEFRKSRNEVAHELSYEAYNYLKNEREQWKN